MLTVLGKDQQPVGFALDNAGAVASDKVFMMDFSFFFSAPLICEFSKDPWSDQSGNQY